DRSRRFHALGPHAVAVDREVFHRRDPTEGGWPPGLEVEEVFHDDGHSDERTGRFLSGEGLFGLAGTRPGLFVALVDDGVERRVALLDPLDRRVDHLRR